MNCFRSLYLWVDLQLKAIYGADEEFHTLTKAIGDARHFALTDVDYLMPNNMRAIARWMNVFEWTQREEDVLLPLGARSVG